MVTGGMVVPFDKMPGALQAVAEVLPAAPLADIMIGSFLSTHDTNGASWVVLAAWAVVMPVLAAWRFEWD